jgi:hypothetical protein
LLIVLFTLLDAGLLYEMEDVEALERVEQYHATRASPARFRLAQDNDADDDEEHREHLASLLNALPDYADQLRIRD